MSWFLAGQDGQRCLVRVVLQTTFAVLRRGRIADMTVPEGALRPSGHRRRHQTGHVPEGPCATRLLFAVKLAPSKFISFFAAMF